jgi:hypothetical protein
VRTMSRGPSLVATPPRTGPRGENGMSTLGRARAIDADRVDERRVLVVPTICAAGSPQGLDSGDRSSQESR